MLMKNENTNSGSTDCSVTSPGLQTQCSFPCIALLRHTFCEIIK